MICIRKKISTLLLALSGVCLCSCDWGIYHLQFSGEGQEHRTKELKVLTLENNDRIPDVADIGTNGVYSFMVVTDTHYGSKRDNNNDRYDDLFFNVVSTYCSTADEAHKPRFLVNLGDVSDSGLDWQYEQYNEMLESLAKVVETRCNIKSFPAYSIVGNHDCYHGGYDAFKKIVYPYTSSYTFTLDADNDGKGFSFYFEDSGTGTLGGNQLQNLQKRMAQDKNPKVVFCHYPLYPDQLPVFRIEDTYERNALLSLYAKNNVKYVLEGHLHKKYFNDFGKFKEEVLRSLQYKDTFYIVTVDEINETVSIETIDFGL